MAPAYFARIEQSAALLCDSYPMADTLVLADHQQTSWRIVIAASPSPSEAYAARELQRFLREITGAEFPIVADTAIAQPHEIRVGRSNRWSFEAERLSAAPGAEGYLIRVRPDHVLITGEGTRGTLYGVYALLENHLGCRWFTREVSHIPSTPRLELKLGEDRGAPAFEYREAYAFEAQDPDWCARNRLNGHFPPFEPQHGGQVRYTTPFVHTFEVLMPVEKYFAAHPEYFSEVNGVRLRHETQLCLSHPDVFAICLQRIREWIAANPDASIVSVSQNDWQNPCQCAQCRAIDEEEGNHSGSLIRFVNRLADGIATAHPHIAIDTLAYQYTRKPPRITRPRPNVIVRLCTIECCFSHPLETCGEKMLLKSSGGTGATLVEDLIAWGRICQRVYVWDYVTNFANYVLPFPNLGVLGPNLRLFARNGVKGVFEQGAKPPGGGGEFAELRAWVLAKLLWNPAQDADALIAEFMHGVYGRGAPALLRYITALRDLVEREHHHASIYDRPDASYLTPELLRFAAACFDEAERLAENDAVLNRIRHARLPIRFAQLSALPLNAPNREEILAQFERDARDAGITQLSEHIPIERTMHYLRQGVHLTHFARYEGGWSPFDNPWPVQ